MNVYRFFGTFNVYSTYSTGIWVYWKGTERKGEREGRKNAFAACGVGIFIFRSCKFMRTIVCPLFRVACACAYCIPFHCIPFQWCSSMPVRQDSIWHWAVARLLLILWEHDHEIIRHAHGLTTDDEARKQAHFLFCCDTACSIVYFNRTRAVANHATPGHPTPPSQR